MAKVNWFKENVLRSARGAQFKALKKVGTVVAKRARANCPVGTEIRGTAKSGASAGKYWTERMPGTLKKSIRSKVILKKMKVQIIAGNRREAFYAAFVDLRIPYMRPALHASHGDIILCFANQMDKA